MAFLFKRQVHPIPSQGEKSHKNKSSFQGNNGELQYMDIQVSSKVQQSLKIQNSSKFVRPSFEMLVVFVQGKNRQLHLEY